MRINKFIVNYIAIFFAILTAMPNILFAQSKNLVEKIWNSAGGKSKWENTKYILFNVVGNPKHNIFSDARTFLIDKNNGNVRFEGAIEGQNVVAIFNIQNQKLSHLFDENGTEKNKEKTNGLVSELIDQYNTDVKVLSLPASIASSSLSAESESKIINAERLQKLAFANFLGQKGNVYISEESGQIKRLDIEEKSYSVNGYKDIGNGLILPTLFKSNLDSISYKKVASFTEMEPAKFNKF